MNKWVMAGMIAVAAVLAAFALVFGTGIMVQTAIAPVGGSLQEIASVQKEIQKKLESAPAADMKAILARLEAIERRVKSLETAGAMPVLERPRPEVDVTTVHDIPVGTSAVLGKANAPITITVFNDFQCPFCGRFYPAAAEAVKAYPDKVKLVLKHYPLGFHPAARPAAKAAMAAGVQGKFYEMTDLLFQNNKTLTDDKFKELAGQLGMNVDQFMKDYKLRDAEWEKQIEADMELGNKIGVRGTPSYYLDGKMTPPGSPEQWKAMIENILKTSVKK